MTTTTQRPGGQQSARPTGVEPRPPAESTAGGPARGPVLAITRVALGLIFLWAFADKTFGLGYATPADRAWLRGGSPTSGFLAGADIGPFQAGFRALSGNPVVDWLFMIGLLGIGVALVLGIALRIAAVTGTVMMVLMWAAEWPPALVDAAGEPTRSTNPVIDYHLIYALLLITLAVVAAGRFWGLGRTWERLVGRQRWLV
ncbi:MAG TPA: hypothetical protein VK020_01050 [Microlunatus sp.]|nr:hypothetical protein [Microlunatus sp.]